MEEKKSLLFVEDEGYVVDRVQEILRSFPQFELTRTESGAEARRLLGERAYDLVITDIEAGGVSALELLHHAREKNKDVCVVIITGVGNADLAAKALKEGAFDFVIKPATLDRLAAILKIFVMVRM